MPKPLVFMMGRGPAFLPVDRCYARNHMWALPCENGFRLGFSAYAVRLLGELHHLAWSVGEGAILEQGAALGYVEASKATSDLFAPISGRVEQIHPEVMADPSLVNRDPYGTGWTFRIAGPGESLLTPEEYLAHLHEVWPLAQRLLKGKLRDEHHRVPPKPGR